MMKNREKIFLIFVVIISLNLIYCGKKQSENTADLNNVQKVENKEQNKNNDTTNETKKSSEKEDEMNYGEGINEEFTTDSLNSFKIEKDRNNYYLTRYVDVSPEEGSKSKIKEEKSKLKLEKDIYLVDDNGLVYAYDTKLKKLVFLNKGNNYRIISVSDDE